MSRKSFFLMVSILLLVGLATLTTVGLLLKHKRAFYTRLVSPPCEPRTLASKECEGKMANLWANLMQRSSEWEETFSEQQLNSYLAEDFLQSKMHEAVLPKGVSDVRVAVEANRLRIGFMYGEGLWSTLVSLDVKAWLAGQEANALVLEIEQVYAGGMPVSAQTLLSRCFDSLRRQNIDVAWYRHDRHPTVVLRFQPSQQRPTVRLDKLEIRAGELVIGGKSLEPTSPRVQLVPRPAPNQGPHRLEPHLLSLASSSQAPVALARMLAAK